MKESSVEPEKPSFVKKTEPFLNSVKLNFQVCAEKNSEFSFSTKSPSQSIRFESFVFAKDSSVKEEFKKTLSFSVKTISFMQRILQTNLRIFNIMKL